MFTYTLLLYAWHSMTRPDTVVGLIPTVSQPHRRHPVFDRSTTPASFIPHSASHYTRNFRKRENVGTNVNPAADGPALHLAAAAAAGATTDGTKQCNDENGGVHTSSRLTEFNGGNNVLRSRIGSSNKHRGRTSSWDRRYDELVQFRSKHGHFIVPHNSTLGRWASNQRFLYRSGSLSSERIAKLNRLNFEWSTRTETWRKRFEELRQFQEEHGHCHVSVRDHPKLYQWATYQRYQYKLFCDNKKSTMTEKRISALVSIGFEFESEASGAVSSFGRHLEALKNYKALNGNCLVPYKYPPNPQLGRWVDTQRTAFRLLKKGKRSPLSPERMRALEEVGFVFDTQDWTWRQNFRLCKDLCKTGKMESVTDSSAVAVEPKLARWIARQSEQYKLFEQNKESTLTSEQVQLLTSIDFPWECQGNTAPGPAPSSTNRRKRRNTPWSTRLFQLRQYKFRHGHCNVPQHYDEDGNQLGLWVKAQRYQYRLLRSVQKSSMTRERLEELTSLGFFDRAGASYGDYIHSRFEILKIIKSKSQLSTSDLEGGGDRDALLHDAWRERFRDLR